MNEHNRLAGAALAERVAVETYASQVDELAAH